MSEARSGAAAVLLPDGRVLVAGGESASGLVASAELFSSNGFFSAAAPMHLARRDHSAVVLPDGRVLVAGGVTIGEGVTNSAEIYDPASNSWSLANSLAQARAGATATLLADGRVLIAGGRAPNGSAKSSLEVYDPASEQFSLLGAVLSSKRKNQAAALLADGRVLIVGGSNGSAALSSSNIFNPADNSVSNGPSMGVAREGLSATSLLNGDVLVAGGSNAGGALASGEVLSSGSFAAVSNSMSAARSGHIAIRLPNNNAVLLVSGGSGDLYRPWAGNFAAAASPSSAHDGGVGAGLADRGLALVAGGGTASAELYGFATVKTDKEDYAPSQTVTITGSGWVPGETVTLTIHEDTAPPFHPDIVKYAVADAGGNISNNQYAPDFHDVGLTMYLTATGSVSTAQNRFKDKPAADLDQCANGGVGDPPVACTEANGAWQNGNLNAQQAHYFEGDFVPYRARFTGLTSGNTYTVRIEWDITHSGDHHSLDYISSYNITEASADPCTGVASTNCSILNTINIPADPALIAPFDGVQVPGVFTVFGGDTLSVGSYINTAPNYTDGAEDHQAIDLTFRSQVTGTVVVAWGGHISRRVDWNPHETAIFINGSPYHMRLIDFDCSPTPTNCSVGNQDRSLSAAAIIFPGTIKIVKDADPADDTAFSFTISPVPPFANEDGQTSPFTLADDADPFDLFPDIGKGPGGFDEFTTYRVTESSIPAGWQLDNITCSVANPNESPGGYVTNVGSHYVDITIEEGEDWTCTFFDSLQTGNLRVIKVVNNNHGGTAVASDFTCEVEKDSVDVTGSPTACAAGPDGVLFSDLIAGSGYVVSESGIPAGYQFVSFTGDCDSSGNISVVAGQTKTCTITNEDITGQLKIEKVCVPADDGGLFNLLRDGSPNGGDATDKACGTDTGFVDVDAGDYVVSETAGTGTDLNDYFAPVISGDCEADGSVTVGLNEQKTCTITNTRKPELKIEKVCSPSDDPGLFDLRVDGSIHGNGDDVACGGDTGFVQMEIGSFVVSETAGTGTDLSDYNSVIGGDCDEEGNVSLAAGDSKTCTITNTHPEAKIEIGNDATNEIRVPHTFTVTVSEDPEGDGTYVAASGETVTIDSITNVGQAVCSLVDTVPNPTTCDDTPTDGSGQCQISVVSSTRGQCVVSVSSSVSIGSVTVDVSSDGSGDSSGPATKTYVGARIAISPEEDTNPVQSDHVLTVTVEIGDGIVDNAIDEFEPAPDDTLVECSIVSGPGSFVGGDDDCTTSGGTGQCTVTITSDEVGTTEVECTTTVEVGGVQLTRTTGTGAPNGPNAIKHWEGGTIVIVKDSIPNDATNFSYTGSGPEGADLGGLAGFQLDDDGSAGNNACSGGDCPSSRSFAPLPAGAYSVVEGDPTPGFDLTGLDCDSTDEADDSSGNTGTRTATIHLSAGETVTCTFENTKRGKIRIVKNTIDKRNATFTYNTTDSDPGLPTPTLGQSNAGNARAIGVGGFPPVFTLTTDSNDGTGTSGSSQGNFDDVKPGSYLFVESQPTDFWQVVNLECDDSNSTEEINHLDVSDNGIPKQGARATVHLDPGETVTCTFTNQFGSFVKVVKATDPSGGQDFEFDPQGFTQGFRVPGDDDSNNNFFLDDGESVTSLWQAPGGVSVQELAKAGYALTGINCVKIAGAGTFDPNTQLVISGSGNGTSGFEPGDDTAAINLPGGVTVECTFTNTKLGTIRIIKDAQPDNPKDFAFEDDVPECTVGPLDDDAGLGGDEATLSNTAECTNVFPATYAVTEQVLVEADGFVLGSIQCVDSDGSGTASSGDTGTRTATINLDPGETVTCTFVNLTTGEGCTPGYWKNHTDRWVGFSPEQTVDSVFTRTGSAPYEELGNATLLQALSFKGGSTIQGAAQILLRAAVAAILNASHPDVSFGLTVAEIVADVNSALDSQDRNTILTLAGELDEANNAVCPLGGTPARPRGTSSESTPLFRPNGNRSGLTSESTLSGSTSAMVSFGGTSTTGTKTDSETSKTASWEPTGATTDTWVNNTESWVPTGYSTDQSVSTVFVGSAVPAYAGLGEATLLMALNYEDGSSLQGAAQVLVRAAVTALLNQSHPDVEFQSPVENITDAVNAALASHDEETIRSLALKLEEANNAARFKEDGAAPKY